MASSLGFVADNQDIIILSLAALTTLLVAWNAYLHSSLGRLRKNAEVFFAGKKAADLEEIILGQIQKSKDLETAIQGLKDADERLQQSLAFAIQKMGVIRFNPFGEVGGNQSFAIAMLDNYNTGVIILSLYSRDGVRIYAKPIKDGKSEYQLSKEEEEALQMAMKR